jgi:8-amino-7-oxononanoate synthase
VGGWWLEALARVRGDEAGRQRLHANARQVRTKLNEQGVETLGEHYIVPIVLGKEVQALAAAAKLQEAGFDIRAIRPPTVPSKTARLRISIHADHDCQTLERAAAAIARAASPHH